MATRQTTQKMDMFCVAQSVLDGERWCFFKDLAVVDLNRLVKSNLI